MSRGNLASDNIDYKVIRLKNNPCVIRDSRIEVDPKLYEFLALVDAIRDGRARERKIAIKEIQSRIT